MDEFVKIGAKYVVGLSVIGALVLFVRLSKQNRLRFAALVVVGGIIAYLFAKLGSHLYSNPRPFIQGHFTPLLPHGNDNGFPSDHTLLAAVLAWAALVYSRKIGAILLVVAVVVGASRMAAGLHHLVDVVGSFAFAALAIWLASLLVNWLAKKYLPAKAEA